MRHRVCHLAFALASLLSACAPDAQPRQLRAVGPKDVAVTFYPNEYLVEYIGGAAVRVFCDVPLDSDVLDWVPTDEQLERIRKADLVVLHGAGLESWFSRADLPLSRVLITTKKMDDRLLRFDASTAHRHGTGPEHRASSIDPHTWLDPQNAKQHALAILERLKRLIPERTDEFEARYFELASDLDQFSEDLKTFASRSLPVAAAHPAYQYLVARYGLEVHNFDLDPSVLPSEEQFAQLGRSDSKLLLWESRPDVVVAEAIAERLGMESLVFSPCEQPPANGEDFLSIQRENVRALLEN